jgi:hypothetical protein
MAKDMTASEEQLDALTRGSKTVTIAGTLITIHELTITQLGIVARASKPIVESMGAQITVDDIPLLAAEHTEAVIDMVIGASGADGAWVRKLPVDQFLLLCVAVWEVDQAFFANRVSPVAKQLAQQMFGGGLMSQSASPATESPTP